MDSPLLSTLPNNIKASVDYFYRLINTAGIIQFVQIERPALEYGYAIEDQARGLIVALRLGDQALVQLFTSLILSAKDQNGVKMLWNGRHQFLDQTDDFGEASGECIWALSELLKVQDLAEVRQMVDQLIVGAMKSRYLRVKSYTLLGLVNLEDKKNATILADALCQRFDEYYALEWRWFEKVMTYANPLLPWSLIESSTLTGDSRHLKIGLASLDFLLENLIHDEVPIAVGNLGWWKKGTTPAMFDQQPIDIAYMVLACLSAYRVTHDQKYLDKAVFYQKWFYGNNLLKASMIRPDGGCFDGLTEMEPNINSGAESIICYLLSEISLGQLVDNAV